FPDHDEREGRRDHHGARHCDAIGRSKRAGGPELNDEKNHADQEQRVDARDVDLTELCLRSMADIEARQGAEVKWAGTGIERLDGSGPEEHGAKSEQPDIAVAKEEAHTVKRIEGCEHGQILRDMPCPADGEHDEPDKRDRAEKSGDPCHAPRLYREQANRMRTDSGTTKRSK